MKQKSKLLFFLNFENTTPYILLGRRISKEGEEYWWIPGGGVEAGEKLFEAAIRELHEELIPTMQITATADKFLEAGINPPSIQYHTGNSENHIFFIQIESFKGVLESKIGIIDEFEEMKWFKLNEIPQNMSREFEHLKEFLTVEKLNTFTQNFDYTKFF